MNQYHIYEAIGRGTHSVVYKGRKKQTIQYYAVKSVAKARKPRVLQEVRAMHALAHPSVLAFHAWYETANHLWLVLEYCVGGDVLALLSADGALPEAAVHDLGAGLASGLAALHAAGGLHRDVKPSNILLDEGGSAKLGGFGLSVRPCRAAGGAGPSAPPPPPPPAAVVGDRLRGSPCYMPPEALWAALRLEDRGDGRGGGGGGPPPPPPPPGPTMAGDLYAFGAVLYHLAAGRPPFVGESLAEVVTAVLAADPPPLPPPPPANAGGAAATAWSPDFVDLVMSLLSKRPGDRPTWAAVAAHPFWRVPLPGPLPAHASPAADTGPADAWMDAVAAGGYSPARLATALASSARSTLDSTADGGEEEEEAGATGGGDGGGGGDGQGDDPARARAAAGRGGPTAVGARAGDVRLESADAEVDFGDVVGSLRVEAGGACGVPVAPPPKPAPAAPVTTTPPPAPTPSMPPLSSDPRSYGLARRGSLPSSSSPAGRTGSPSPVRGGLAGSTSSPGHPPHTPLNPLVASIGGALVWAARAPGDAAVSPIVGNPRVEGPGGGASGLPPPLPSSRLPFADPLPLEAVLAAPPAELAALLLRIYRALADPATRPADADAALAYVCGLASDAGAANALVNSSLALLLVRLLDDGRGGGGGQASPVDLPARAAAALGLLVRHATYVADELAGAGLAPKLAALAEGGGGPASSLAARRRAAAALGEVAFYAASQGGLGGADDGGPGGAGANCSAGPWASTPAAVGPALVRLLSDADPIVRHCASKAVENIAARPDAGWAAALATGAAVRALAAAAAGGYARVCAGGSTASDPTAASAAATAASALARLLRVDPALAGDAVRGGEGPSSVGPSLWAALAPGGPPRARAPAATLLCALLASPCPSAVRCALPGRGASGAAAAASLAALADGGVGGGVVSGGPGSTALCAAPSAARGRALAAAALALAADPGWLPCLTSGAGARLLASCARSSGGPAEHGGGGSSTSGGDPYARAAGAALARSAAAAAASALRDAATELKAGRAPAPEPLAAAVAVLAGGAGVGRASEDAHPLQHAGHGTGGADAAAADLAAALGEALAAAVPGLASRDAGKGRGRDGRTSTADAEAAWEEGGGGGGGGDDASITAGRARAALLAGAEALLLGPGARLRPGAAGQPPPLPGALDAALASGLVPPLASLAGARASTAAAASPTPSPAAAAIEAERLTAVRLLAGAADLARSGGAPALAAALSDASVLPAISACLASPPPAPLFAAKLADGVVAACGRASPSFIRALARCGALSAAAGAAARGTGGAAALRLLSSAASAGALATADALAAAGSAASAALRRAAAGEAGAGEPEAAAWLVAAVARVEAAAAGTAAPEPGKSLAARLAAGHGTRLLGGVAAVPDAPASRAAAAALAALAAAVCSTPAGAALLLGGPAGPAFVSALAAARTAAAAGDADASAASLDLVRALATAASGLVRRGGGGSAGGQAPAAGPDRATLVALRSEARAAAAVAAAAASATGFGPNEALESSSAAVAALDTALGL